MAHLKLLPPMANGYIVFEWSNIASESAWRQLGILIRQMAGSISISICFHFYGLLGTTSHT